MRLKLLLSTLGLLFLQIAGNSQDKANVKFGDVSVKDFANKIYSIDSAANAVVIADIGSSKIEGNTKGWFSLVFKHYKRVHILNKNGYDIANVEIPLYTDDDDEENLTKLKAVTYNLENGKVVETKLDVKGNVFKDKINKNLVIKKFTFPNVKEGSIIEYEYTQTSDFLQNLQPWEFQGGYPRLWSEYNLELPRFLGYVFLSQGDKVYDISTVKEENGSYTVTSGQNSNRTDYTEVSAPVGVYRWVKKNVKPLKEENFTSALSNYISKIEFQLSELREPLVYRKVMSSWPELAKTLLEADYFGQQLNKDNGWLKDIVNPVLIGAETPVDKAKKIYALVRDNFTCTNYQRRMMEQNLKSVAKSKSGNVAEINLLLTAMLKFAGLDADPVLLSTRSNGFPYSMYPLLAQYNYVISKFATGGKTYYLDASEPGMGFGRLPLRCYNGDARVINEEALAVDLNTDSVMESKFTSVFVINDDKGNIQGSMQQTPGYYESFDLRSKVKEKGKEQLQADIRKAFGTDIKMSNFKIGPLDNPDTVLTMSYDFDLLNEKEDIIYFNPLFGEGYKENPFKSAERYYPVEMPYKMDETYTLQMEVPAGYVVDELPKSIMVKLNEQNEGMFEYRISQSSNIISFRLRITISRTVFQPSEYKMLREFFNLVVKKQAEQIVFKKKE